MLYIQCYKFPSPFKIISPEINKWNQLIIVQYTICESIKYNQIIMYVQEWGMTYYSGSYWSDINVLGLGIGVTTGVGGGVGNRLVLTSLVL